jgi:release factor glutamine methyltransferase
MPKLVQQAVRDTTAALRRAGVAEPAREAMVLAAWAGRVSQAAILIHPERRLDHDEENRLRRAVQRRERREPLAYITGRVEFFGLELEVDPRVLVPRPETEHVVECVLAVAGEWEQPLIADLGTGSGCIAVALARCLDRAVVYAVDASADALAVAAANVRRHQVEGRVRLLQGDLLAPLSESVHVVASNPPYIATDDFPALMPEVRDHEPRAALDGGADGLAVIRRLLQAAPAHLLAGGALVMETGATQGGAVLALAREHFACARIECDLAGLDRVLVARI